MRVLLDNCLDVRVKTLFAGHDVEHVLDRGWETLANGRLLASAAGAKFQAFATVDKNLRYQQNLERLPLTVIELDVHKNRMDQLLLISPFIQQAIDQATRFRFLSIKPDGFIECLAERVPLP